MEIFYLFLLGLMLLRIYALRKENDLLVHLNLQYIEAMRDYTLRDGQEKERYRSAVLDIVEGNETPNDTHVLARVAWHQKKLKEVDNQRIKVHFFIFRDGFPFETWDEYQHRLNLEKRKINAACLAQLRLTDPKSYYSVVLYQHIGT